MRKLFNLSDLSLQDPASIARLAVAVLVLLNIVAGYFVLRPPGGSPDELSAAASSASVQLQQKKMVLDRTRTLMTKIKDGREKGDSFLTTYFLPAGKAYSTIYSDLVDLATKAKMTPRESSFTIEQVEGSDTLSMMTITQALEGKYGDLIHFVNALDKSDRLLIVDSLTATPQTNGNLSVLLRLQTFVREDAVRQ
jgi:Tfp pilus assembly protein PilO